MKEIRRLSALELLEIPPNHEFMESLQVELEGTELVFRVSDDTKETALAPRTMYDPMEGVMDD